MFNYVWQNIYFLEKKEVNLRLERLSFVFFYYHKGTWSPIYLVKYSRHLFHVYFRSILNEIFEVLFERIESKKSSLLTLFFYCRVINLVFLNEKLENAIKIVSKSNCYEIKLIKSSTFQSVLYKLCKFDNTILIFL